MIYFIQDAGSTYIKIGYAAGIAESGQKAGETWCPFGLVVIATMDGDKRAEAELHARFADARVNQGREWFRPTPDLLRFIFEHAEHESLASRDGAHFRPAPWPLKIYLAGKISKRDWRARILPQPEVDSNQSVYQSGIGDGPWLPDEWPVAAQVIGVHSYVGPYFLGCDHGCFHGDDSHGVGANEETSVSNERTDQIRRDVVRLCRNAVARADLIFAWIDQPDCYGTIAELGLADAFTLRNVNKQIWVAGPKCYRDMWFVYQMASRTHFNSLCPADAFHRMFADHFGCDVSETRRPAGHGVYSVTFSTSADANEIASHLESAAKEFYPDEF